MNDDYGGYDDYGNSSAMWGIVFLITIVFWSATITGAIILWGDSKEIVECINL